MLVEELVSRLGLELDETAFAKGEAALHALHRGVLAFGIAAATGAAVGLAAMVNATARAGDEARKLSQRTGVDSIALQQLGYAASLAGVGQEELAVGLQHLARTGVKDVRAGMLALADQFSRMPDGGEKTKIAMEKFGRAGARLIPLLNGGREKLAAFAAEADELGIVFDAAGQIAGENFHDSLTTLEFALVGLRNRIGSALIPVLTKMVEKATALVKVFTNAKTGARNLELALRGMAITVATLLAPKLLAMGSTIQWLGGLFSAAGRQATLAWLKATLPIVAAIALVALAGLMIEDIVGTLKGEDSVIKDWMRWTDRLLDPNAAEPSWLKFLKDGLYYVTHLDMALDRLGKWFFADLNAATATAQQQFMTAAPQASLDLGRMAPIDTANATSFVLPAVNVVVNAAPGQSEEAVGRIAAQRLAEELRAAESEAVRR